MDFANCVGDRSFGPAVEGCRDNFDFTLKFELLFFAIVPSAVFLVLAISRTIFLSREPVVTSWRSWLFAAKLVIVPCGPEPLRLNPAPPLVALQQQHEARGRLRSPLLTV